MSLAFTDSGMCIIDNTANENALLRFNKVVDGNTFTIRVAVVVAIDDDDMKSYKIEENS